jgi:subtilase family serine protease
VRGAGRTIAIIDSFGAPTLRSDLHMFDAAFNLPDPALSIMTPLGTATHGERSWADETTLDVEWAHAMAPEARLVVLESPVSETQGTQGMSQFLTLERYVVQHHLDPMARTSRRAGS